METKLKPCPFCGGEAELREYRRWLDFPKEMVDGYEVICVNRDCIIYHADDVWFKTEAEAVEAWNTRAERTCRMTQYGPEYVLEGWWHCSECEGPVYPPCNEEIAVWALQQCPRCGAKVVE